MDVLEQELRLLLTSGSLARPLGLATGRTMEPVYAGLVKRLQTWSGSDLQKLRKVWSSFNLDEYIGLEGRDPRSYQAFMDAWLGQPLQFKNFRD